MKLQNLNDVDATEVPAPAEGVRIRWLIDEKAGAPNFAMRHFEIAPGGATPFHDHEWEHEVFMLSGSGVVVHVEGETAFGPGDAILMPAGERHCFRNTGDEPATMLCLVPLGACCSR